MNKGAKENYLNIRGWLYAGRYQVERYAYILHRVTGLGILTYLFMHIYVTGFRIKGKEVWEGVMSSVQKPVFHIGEYLLFLAVAFHAINGLRLILQELGLFLPAPIKPVYPYATALSRVRIFFWALILLALVIMFIGGLDFFVFHNE